MATKKNAHKDAEMAQRLRGTSRGTGRCLICHNVVANGGNHTTMTCQGPHRKGEAGTNVGVLKPGGE